VLGAIGLGMICMSIPRFFSFLIEAIGFNIHQKNLPMDYVIGLMWAIVLGMSILFWPVPSKDKNSLLLIWLVRVLVTLGFMVLVEAHYPGMDAYGYFNMSMTPNCPWKNIWSMNGTQIITALAWLHHQILPCSYYATKVSFSMSGFIAMYIFYRTAVIFSHHENKRIFYVLALFPSTLFWSSILGKDPIVLLGVALYAYGVVGIYQFKKKRFLGILLLGVMIAMVIRMWMGLILLAPLTIFVFYLRQRSGIFKAVLIILISIAFLFSLNRFKNGFQLESGDDVLQTATNLSQSASTGGSSPGLSMEFTSPGKLIAFLPIGIFTVLFRPLPGEFFSNPFAFIASIENLAFLAWLVLALKRKRWRELKNPLGMWAISVVVIWTILYAPVSSGNLGTAMRYKIQILPILLILLLHMLPPRILNTKYLRG